MKLFVVIVVLSTLAVAVKSGFNQEEAMTTFVRISTACKEETGATDADIEALIKHEPAGSMEAKCLTACILKKIEVMSADGKFVKEVAMKFAHLHLQGDAAKMQVAEELIDTCKDIPVSDNHCEAAEQYGVCLKAEAMKRGIKPDEF